MQSFTILAALLSAASVMASPLIITGGPAVTPAKGCTTQAPYQLEAPEYNANLCCDFDLSYCCLHSDAADANKTSDNGKTWSELCTATK